MTISPVAPHPEPRLFCCRPSGPAEPAFPSHVLGKAIASSSFRGLFFLASRLLSCCAVLQAAQLTSLHFWFYTLHGCKLDSEVGSLLPSFVEQCGQRALCHLFCSLDNKRNRKQPHGHGGVQITNFINNIQHAKPSYIHMLLLWLEADFATGKQWVISGASLFNRCTCPPLPLPLLSAAAPFTPTLEC